MTISIATEKDVDVLVYFIKKLAIVEEFSYEINVTAETLKENLFEENSPATALICYEKGKPCGFALYYYTFSTIEGKKGLHLDDLFIEPEYQGRGFGFKVMSHLAKIAKEYNCARFEWWVVKTNVSAISFYKKIGAFSLDEISVFRLNNDPLLKLSSFAGL